jgi:hypothetical protein
MEEHLIKKIKILLIIFCIIILSGCEDLFLRFKYETYGCQPNRANLNKIFIKNYDQGDEADVEIGDYLYKFKITYISDQKMYLVQEAEDFVIKIYRKTNKIEARVDNLILNVKCTKETFKM